MSFDKLTKRMIAESSARFESLVPLMIRCFDLIEPTLPTPALVARSTARQFWIDGSVSKDDLECSRDACWRYLDERGATLQVEQPEVAAVRALICLLYADCPSDEIVDLVDFFNEMLWLATGKGDRDDLETRLIHLVSIE